MFLLALGAGCIIPVYFLVLFVPFNALFLFLIKKMMGFRGNSIGWIEQYISTASFAVLIIGNATGFFNSFKGDKGTPCHLTCLFLE